MKRIASMLEQDLKLLLRNAIFWVMAATLILIIIAVKFLIPAEFSVSDPALAVYGFAYSLPGSAALESPAAVERHVRETGGVGVVKQGDQLTVIHAGLSDQAATALITLITPPEGALPDLQTTVLRSRAGTIPQNLRLLPVFIGFEAVVLGFLMAAVLMLGEKQEQVLKAYRISPGGPLTYMASKTLLFAGMGVLYSLLMVVATIGVRFDWLSFILLTVLASALYTLVGLSVAVFFREINDWFPIAVVMLSLNMLPMVSYSLPSFAPTWLTWIPSYPIIFAYEEILFATGKPIASTYLILAAQVAVALALCARLVKRKLLSAH